MRNSLIFGILGGTLRETPEDDISVSNLFDGEQYGEHSYISYLVDRLVENHIMQCNYAGEPTTI